MQYWKNKRILITGFEGFVGSNLTKKVLGYGAKVAGLDIKVYRDNTIFTKEDYKKISVVKGNVANYKLIKETIEKYDIEIIFHLAAEAIVGRALRDPVKTFSSNIAGTWNILEACRGLASIQAIIIASSDKAYGSHKKLPYKEGCPLCGRHPYDVSKSCADLIASAYFHTYGLPVGITRCGNIYGPGDLNFCRIVPDTIRSVFTDSTLFIRSDGKFTRDYIYVDDILNGYLLFAKKLRQLKLQGEAFNFSNGNPVSILHLIRKIYSLLNTSANYKILNQAKYEIRNQYLSAQKAKIILGWQPKFTLDEGLIKTIDWYKDYFHDKRT